MNGFGMFFLLMYPGAFVDLSSEHLQVVSPLRQLRIYCAGVWHNFVIVVVALIVLLSQPALLMPFYSTGQAVAITSVAEVKLLTSLRAELISHDLVIACVKLQALVYDILPSTTAVFSYAIGSRKLSANEQFFVDAQTGVRLLQTTQIISHICFITDHVAYASSNKTKIV